MDELKLRAAPILSPDCANWNAILKLRQILHTHPICHSSLIWEHKSKHIGKGVQITNAWFKKSNWRTGGALSPWRQSDVIPGPETDPQPRPWILTSSPQHPALHGEHHQACYHDHPGPLHWCFVLSCWEKVYAAQAGLKLLNQAILLSQLPKVAGTTGMGHHAHPMKFLFHTAELVIMQQWYIVK